MGFNLVLMQIGESVEFAINTQIVAKVIVYLQYKLLPGVENLYFWGQQKWGLRLWDHTDLSIYKER